MTTYDKIYEKVKAIPYSKVTSYGRIAEHIPKCTARMVGYALSALPDGSDVPWWRVVNSQLKISLRTAGGHHNLQKELLMSEGVTFKTSEKIDPQHLFTFNKKLI
jgi:methylated-DNA-protein-cysteine methyltransferase-like protein